MARHDCFNLLVLLASVPALVLIPYSMTILLNPCSTTPSLHTEILENGTFTYVDYRVKGVDYSCKIAGAWFEPSNVCYALFQPSRCALFCQGSALKGLACFSVGCAWLFLLVCIICLCVCQSIDEPYRQNVILPVAVYQQQLSHDPARQQQQKPIPLRVGVVEVDKKDSVKLGRSEQGNVVLIISPSESSR